MEASVADAVLRGIMVDKVQQLREREIELVERATEIVILMYGPALCELGQGVISPPHTPQKGQK